MIDRQLDAALSGGFFNQGKNPRLALHLVARLGLTDPVKKLLDNGADINLRDSQGRTPLRTAVMFGKLDLAILLVHNGADVEQEMCRRYPFCYYGCSAGTVCTPLSTPSSPSPDQPLHPSILLTLEAKKVINWGRRKNFLFFLYKHGIHHTISISPSASRRGLCAVCGEGLPAALIEVLQVEGIVRIIAGLL